ncbi:MAG TPA: glucosaminidase domain-containing protein [Flavobacterium sp.]|nr:glucosaminidase domain-containing protein [Flavobacterium sp.]
MKPNEFVKHYYQIAQEVEEITGIPAIAILAQAALESGWGAKKIGNNLFGIKYKKGDFGYQKVLTTEYSSDPKKFDGQEINHKQFDNESKKWKFKVWQYFADYETELDGFMAHAKLLTSDRYIHALEYADDPVLYLRKIAESGYATDYNYAVKMAAMVESIKKRL